MLLVVVRILAGDQDVVHVDEGEILNLGIRCPLDAGMLGKRFSGRKASEETRITQMV